MESLSGNTKGLKRLLLINALIFSTLIAEAGPMDKVKKLFGNDTDFLTIFYIIGAMFVFCILLYFIGNYFMKKEEAKNAGKATAKPSVHTQMRRQQRRRK